MTATVFISALMAGAALFWGWAPAQLVMTPAALDSGEAWRVVSGQLVHSDWNHLLMNLGGLVMCGLLFSQQIGRHLVGLLLAGGLAVSVLVTQGSLFTEYCGLSGALNAVFVGGCLLRAAMPADPLPRWCWLLLPGLDLVKIVVETMRGEALFSQIAWTPAPEAHLAGWLSGVLYLSALFAWRRLFPRGHSATVIQRVTPIQ